MRVVKEGEYYFIFNNYYDLNKKYNNLYVFDSNVTVDVASLYYKINIISEDNKNKIGDLITYIKNDISAQINYRYSLTELCCERCYGGVIEDKYKRLSKGVDEILRKDNKSLKKFLKYGKVLNENSLDKSIHEFGNISDVINKTLPLLYYAYVSIGEMFILLKDLTKNNKIELFKKYVDVLDNKIKMIGGYELAAAVYYMLNNDVEFNSTQSLLKVNNKIEIIEKLWNVSWDITFLRFINENSRLLINNEKTQFKGNCILITKDRALAKVADLLVMGFDKQFNKTITGFSIDESKVKKEYSSEYSKIINDVMSSEKYIKRVKYLSSLDSDEQNHHFALLADEITEELMSIY